MVVTTRRIERCVVALALLGAMAGCERQTSAKTEKAAAAPPPLPEVVIASVEQRPIAIERDFTARTDAVPTVEIRARVTGVLEEVLFKEGTEVTKGQTLFVIQREEYKAALETAKAQLAKARADLTRARDTSVVERARAQLAQRQADLEKARQDVARYRPLAEARAIPQQDLDTSLAQEKVAAAAVDTFAAQLKDAELAQRTQIQLAEAAVEAGKAAFTQAELNLGYTTLTSPITGVIGKVMVDQGNLVGKGEPTLLATVSSVDPIYVDFSIPEADYLRLAPRVRRDPQGRVQDTRTPLDLFLTGDRPFPHKGHLVFVERAVDAKTGTIAVRAAFPNPDKLIRPPRRRRPGAAARGPGAARVEDRAGGGARRQGGAAAGEGRRAHRRFLRGHRGAQAGRAGDRRRAAAGASGRAGEGRGEAGREGGRIAPWPSSSSAGRSSRSSSPS
jgi:membrane fusion protein, multidrug efflux system